MSTKTSVDKSLLVNFLFAFRDVPAECALIGCQLCRYQFFTSSSPGQWRPSSIFWRAGVTIQLLTALNQGWGHHPPTKY